MAKATPTVITRRNNPRRRNRRRKRGLTFPLSIAVPMLSTGAQVIEFGKHHGYREGLRELILYFGVDLRTGTPAFTTHYLRYGAYPLLGGILIHNVANKLGVNRALARAGIPFIRI
ncbi:unnamed protein product [marine sediment metagenome]|uniref:Uncharacterized protein n=1 Tax=marine sediment metagenome TaxID=412755 RepID=X1JA11_9ZZZZ